MLADPRDRDIVCRIFACSAEIAEHILTRARPKSYPAHATMVRHDDRVTATFLLVEGRARAILYAIDGKLVLLQEFAAGDFFGALGELDPGLQGADVIAVEDVRALLINGPDLVTLAEVHGCIGLALSRLLLERLRRTTTRMFEQAALSAVGRVYAELLRQARQAQGLTIRPAPVLADLAVHVATTRETVSRAVNALVRRGIIRRSDDELVVVAPHRLEELIL